MGEKRTSGINVLSTFNGMGCIWIALDRLGIKVNKRFSSEIDKYSNIVNNNNYPNTIQLGDICGVQYEDGALLHHQNDNPLKNGGSFITDIDLLVGGSPCQGFSCAGKQLNFDDPRSKLFFEFVRLLKETKPRYFLLENVKMKKEYQDIITEYLGVEPIEINSALVSAQNRKRLYWTNILGVTQPDNKGVLLKDILEDSDLLNGASIKGRYLNKGIIVGRRLNKSGHREDYNKSVKITQCLEVRKDNSKSNCLTTVEKDNIITNIEHGRHPDVYNKSKKMFNVNPSGNGMNGWVYDPDYKSPTLTINKGEGSKIFNEASNKKFRTLTPVECERLQTVPDNYTNHVSNSQRYKMLGNGWTVDVIAHILKNMLP